MIAASPGNTFALVVTIGLLILVIVWGIFNDINERIDREADDSHRRLMRELKQQPTASKDEERNHHGKRR